jgi:hypothetical protein
VKTLLIQTTIAANGDDWSIQRFSYLVRLLADLRDARGQAEFKVLARDRDAGDGPDSLLSLWIAARSTSCG